MSEETNNGAETIGTEVATRELIKAGWYKDISNEEYHSSNGTSSSSLKTLLEWTPAHLDYGKTHPKESTENMDLGTLVHTLVLEPHMFDEEYIVLDPDIKKPTSAQLNANKPAQKTLDQIADWDLFHGKVEGRKVIKQGTYDTAKAMAARVHDHPIAGILVKDLIVESSVYQWYTSMDREDQTEYKELLKVRPDGASKNMSILVDLKTTADASYSGFIKSIQNFYYHMSAAMYLELCNKDEDLLNACKHFAFTKFVFVCVENFPPHEVACYELSDEYRDLGKVLFRTAVSRLHEGKKEEWAGYPEEVRVIEPPNYAKNGFIV